MINVLALLETVVFSLFNSVFSSGIRYTYDLEEIHEIFKCLIGVQNQVSANAALVVEENGMRDAFNYSVLADSGSFR